MHFVYCWCALSLQKLLGEVEANQVLCDANLLHVDIGTLGGKFQTWKIVAGTGNNFMVSASSNSTNSATLYSYHRSMHIETKRSLLPTFDVEHLQIIEPFNPDFYKRNASPEPKQREHTRQLTYAQTLV